jgi:hypothetical protein
MLAFDDAALARLMIGATRVPVHRRRSWLKRIARHVDGTRQAKYRQRQEEGLVVVPVRMDAQEAEMLLRDVGIYVTDTDRATLGKAFEAMLSLWLEGSLRVARTNETLR